MQSPAALRVANTTGVASAADCRFFFFAFFFFPFFDGDDSSVVDASRESPRALAAAVRV